MVPMILVPSFRRISSARAASALHSDERRARPKINLPRMIASMAKQGIDRQASGAGRFPPRHRPYENLKSLASNLQPLVRGPNSGGEFLHGVESKLFVEAHSALVARSYGERNRRKVAHAERLQGRFHGAASEAAALVSGHGADLRGVADALGDARIQDYADQMVGVRSAQHKRGLGLELSAAGQDDDVFKETQGAGFAAVLIVDFAVDMVRIRELDQPRAWLEITVIPPLEDQPCSGSFPDEPRKNVERLARVRSERRDHELPHIQAEAVLGQDRIEVISEGDQLRLHAVELGDAAQRGQCVGQKPLAQILLGEAG